MRTLPSGVGSWSPSKLGFGLETGRIDPEIEIRALVGRFAYRDGSAAIRDVIVGWNIRVIRSLVRAGGDASLRVGLASLRAWVVSRPPSADEDVELIVLSAAAGSGRDDVIRTLAAGGANLSSRAQSLLPVDPLFNAVEFGRG